MDVGELLLIYREHMRNGLAEHSRPAAYSYGVYLGAEPGCPPLVLFRTLDPSHEDGRALVVPLDRVEHRRLELPTTLVTISGFIGFQLPDSAHIALWMEPGWQAFQSQAAAIAHIERQPIGQQARSSVA